MKISHEYNGETYDAQVMQITNTFLGYEDHGLMTMHLDLESPGSAEVFGIGWGIENYYIQNEIKRWLDGVFDVTGARNWEDVKGKMVLALYTDSYDKKCMGLASIYGDKTFIFDES